ncbi:MAG: Omp28-related outer membrane protein [Crocinitomicaceae bacterium]|nr:Omp28-related outer membrane protein [Flavobacteriales bacterium]NQZ36287.1 Omp28-related outer membrane protein [Crocinitomicaceae bacterium]
MKKSLFILTLALVGFTSCDKVENTHPVSGVPEGDWNLLYPSGDSAAYVTNEWPTFSSNPNVNRTILIEDFTGHTCTFCPFAAEEAHQIATNNPGRVLISTLHTSHVGVGVFQELELPYFTYDFTNSFASGIGLYFGYDWVGSGFNGNPKGMISRAGNSPDQPVLAPLIWSAKVDELIVANDLKTNIQSVVNYFPSTRGVFLHTEVEILDVALTNDLYVVTQLHVDSIISPQKFPGGTFPEPDPYDHIDFDYVHRDILEECIDGKTFGEKLDLTNIDPNGKYYLNYAYKLPEGYNADNVHLLIYVRDAVTEEVYQVIKKHL